MENYNRIEKYELVTYYFLNNKFHRIDGPAKEYNNGDKCWYQNDQFHRTDGPAIENVNGTKMWYQNGLLHRIDGPAIEWNDGDKFWYYEDEFITDKSQEEFERIIKLRLFW